MKVMRAGIKFKFDKSSFIWYKMLLELDPLNAFSLPTHQIPHMPVCIQRSGEQEGQSKASLSLSSRNCVHTHILWNSLAIVRTYTGAISWPYVAQNSQGTVSYDMEVCVTLPRPSMNTAKPVIPDSFMPVTFGHLVIGLWKERGANDGPGKSGILWWMLSCMVLGYGHRSSCHLHGICFRHIRT